MGEVPEFSSQPMVGRLVDLRMERVFPGLPARPWEPASCFLGSTSLQSSTQECAGRFTFHIGWLALAQGHGAQVTGDWREERLKGNSRGHPELQAGA